MAHFPRGHASAAGAAAILAILWSPQLTAQTPAPPAYPSSPYRAAPYPNQPSYPAPASPPLQTGGLTPPSSSSAPRPGETETYQQLNRAEREDAGRGLEFVWLAAESGYEYLSLEALHGSSLLDGSVIAPSGSALVLGAGVGVRVIFLTFGAHVRLARQSAWDLWTFNAEVGLHLPLGEIEPSFTLSAGYATLGSFAAAPSAAGFDSDRIDIGGFDGRLGAALDWYINPLLSLGAHGSLEILVLSRSRAAPPEGVSDATPALTALYGRDGSGVGLGASVTAVVGLHF
ncbi:MAG: hypothetical protein RL685_3957 [Pseudomonadota bacterium]|jgi:hypothetical protein